MKAVFFHLLLFVMLLSDLLSLHCYLLLLLLLIFIILGGRGLPFNGTVAISDGG